MEVVPGQIALRRELNRDEAERPGCACLETMMLFRHNLAQTVKRDRREAAVAETRWFGWARALAAVLFAASLSVMSSPVAFATGKVNVLYAGSLVNLMEHGVGLAFGKATGNQFQGYAGGSVGLANQIKGKLRQGDVFISANPKVNDGLMDATNGNWESWYITFAQSALVIGYNPSSKFAAEFKRKPWYQVLQEPGIRIGRTDTKLDPKGALTLTLLKQAEIFYHSPGLSEEIIGRPSVPEDLEPSLLQSGVLDVGFFYSTETADAKIPALSLPPAITPKAIYTITILHGAPNPEGADKFVAFLLGSDGRKVMKDHGLDVQKPTLTGDATSVPKDTQAFLNRAK
jgi:molybdate/tungstate transport system substrate-binding protein